MICVNNDLRCHNQGYCSCHHDNTAEAASGCGEILIFLIAGVVLSFLYPSLKIMRSNAKFEDDGSQNFVGAMWLFTSPLFGLLSTMLFQIVFALGACAAEALQSKVTNSVFVAGTFAIYVLATGVASITFVIKNRIVIKNFLIESSNRTARKTATLAGLILMLILFCLAGIGFFVTMANGYFINQSNVQNSRKKHNDLISNEIKKFDSYIGKYRLITRSDKELFVVSKSSDGKILVLNMDNGKDAESGNRGCLLTPGIEENSIYYSVSNCTVDGKESPLAKVYFRIENNKTKMDFVYNIRASGDTLEKIK